MVASVHISIHKETDIPRLVHTDHTYIRILVQRPLICMLRVIKSE